MTVLNAFPPLQSSIAHAESWRNYLNTCQDELRSPHAQSVIAKAEHSVGIGVWIGDSLPITWRAAFHGLFRPGVSQWKSVKEFEAFRKQARAWFYTVREAMDSAWKTAEILQTLTGRQPAGIERLRKAIEDARELEERVFRDWPSFSEPWLAADSLPVDESLAEALGITAEEARQKMDARRQRLSAGGE